MLPLADEQDMREILKGTATMSVLESLRKGFGFFLMSMGISRPSKKAKPAPKPESGP